VEFVPLCVSLSFFLSSIFFSTHSLLLQHRSSGVPSGHL
jgi:hypothetical protein